jgi:hypothetical protein
MEEFAAEVTNSWQPVDLGPYLRGEKKRVEPAIGLARIDGLRLLYPGKEHTCMGEMESGKTWFCAACAAAELLKGNHVLYVHFEEETEDDTVERLLALGVPDDVILGLFHFVAPDRPIRPGDWDELLALAPTLVILDGINEAMSLHSLAIRDEDGAANFRRLLVKPCTAVGAAVLAADHVVKDREKRDRTPLGSIHKGNGLTGALILLENKAAFGRGERGCSHMFITKDRPGHLRRNGRPDKKTPGKTYIGSLIVDDTRDYSAYLELVFTEPAAEADVDVPPVDTTQTDDDLVFATVEKLVRELVAKGKDRWLSTRQVKAQVAGISDERTAKALDRSGFSGRLLTKTGPRKAVLYTVPTEAGSPDLLSGLE